MGILEHRQPHHFMAHYVHTSKCHTDRGGYICLFQRRDNVFEYIHEQDMQPYMDLHKQLHENRASHPLLHEEEKAFVMARKALELMREDNPYAGLQPYAMADKLFKRLSLTPPRFADKKPGGPA